MTPTEPSYCRIPLTYGYFAIVDPVDTPELDTWKWRAMRLKKSKGFAVYAAGSKVSDEGCIHMTCLMHRLLTKCPIGLVVDHANGNGLDNRRSNLRVCTRSQNLANTGIAIDNKSGYKGVSWSSARKMWVVHISVQGKMYAIGRFFDKVQAAKAYDERALAEFGEFAFLNFPQEN